MKAIVYEQYGSPSVLRLKRSGNALPKANGVLIKADAAAVNSGDVRLLKADPFAVRFMFELMRPKIPIPGVVLAVEIMAF